MRYFAYLFSRCEESAKKHGFFQEVQNLSAKLERDQSIETWAKFLPSPYIKKDLGSFRLIAEKRVIEPDIVIILLVVLPRGSADYEKFLADPHVYCKDMVIADHELKNEVDRRRTSIEKPLSEPSQNEFAYLYDSKGKLDASDGVVFESKDWVEQMNTQENQDYFVRYYDMLRDLITPSEKPLNLAVSRNSPVRILYRFEPEHNRLFLIAPLIGENSAIERSMRNKYANVLDCSTEGIQPEELLRLSGRSYPMIIFAHDESAWKAIQKNTAGNLALSPEEFIILDAIQNSVNHNQRMYPLFINGRPGSGKSTILQYLFAERLFLHLRKEKEHQLPHPPLYLTYSERLIQQAKNSVRTILECNSEYLENKIDLGTPEIMTIFNASFGEFHSHLLELLNETDRKPFEANKRIDFPRFQREWHAASKADPDQIIRSLSPELVWHVIRTYIKGMRDDAGMYMDSDLYAELPSKQHTVTRDTYERIFHRAWEKWYKSKCEKDGWWDNQDLARKVIDTLSSDLSRYPAVFCDEAQDFTKLELELILKLCLFSRKHVLPNDLRRIPFAFAGDPFQTLNPTGFEWGAVQAGFYEKIVQELDKTSAGKLDFNYHELSFNYRSTKNIVGFCNLLQLIRGIVFDIKDLKPQKTWFEEDSPMPALYDIKNPSCQRSIEEQSELVIILPCQEGEENTYVMQDEFLQGIANSGVGLRNFLSPMSAKGLEFKRVVLYKFGHECVQNYPTLLNPLDTGISHTSDPEASLPLEYFINRLYVAASRAMRRLFIVETTEGIEAFWNSDKLRGFDALVNSYSSGTRHTWTRDDLSGMQPGYEAIWSVDRDDPIRLAEVFKEAGISERDPYKLRLAESTFSRTGRLQDALACRAIRLEFEDNLEEAGGAYLDLGNTERAIKCWWKSKNYGGIQSRTEFANSIEQRAADFMVSSKSVADCNKLLEFLTEKAIPLHKSKIAADPGWRDVVEVLIQRFAEIPLRQSEWPPVYQAIKDLETNGIEFDPHKGLGEVAYKAKEFVAAADIWDSTPGFRFDRKDYMEAKATISLFPKSIPWLQKLRREAEIVEQWKKNQFTALSKPEGQIVVDCLISQRELSDAANLLARYPDKDLYLDVIDEAESSRDIAVLQRVVRQYIAVLIQEDSLKEALSFTKEQEGQLLPLIASQALLRELASAEHIARQPSDTTNSIQAYLKKSYIESPWNRDWDLVVVGAAIERAGRIIDSLEFYEMVWKSKKIPASEAEIKHAKERWVTCKYRFATHLSERRSDSEPTKHRDEADRLAAEWHLSTEIIHEWPDLGASIDSSQEETNQDSVVTPDQVVTIDLLLAEGWDTARIAATLKIDPQFVEDIVRTKK